MAKAQSGIRSLAAGLTCFGLMAFLAAALAQDDDIAKGKALAEKNCMSCHAIGATGNSALKDAPPFRDIAALYGDGELEDSFNDGVVTDHPAMPDWQMNPDQARQLAAYIMSLAVTGKARTELEAPVQSLLAGTP